VGKLHNENDRTDVSKALDLKKQFEDKMSLVKQYGERIKTATAKVNQLHAKYQNGKALIGKVSDLMEMLK
jgi:hypothetical protein